MAAGEGERRKERGEKRKKSDGEIPDLMSGAAEMPGAEVLGSLQDADGQDRNLLPLPILLEQ